MRSSGSSCQGTSRRKRSMCRLRAMANTQPAALPFSSAYSEARRHTVSSVSWARSSAVAASAPRRIM